MSYVVFARRWRPQDFDEVIGQEHITVTLKNAISNNRVAHAYIFTGPRGIGKTSVARIFAKGLNCEKGQTPSPCNKCVSCSGISSGTNMDIIEIDGASNNSVDQVRELRESVKFAPSYGRYKIYIIDEVHMLSIGAFNALLKTLEEPPKHVKFIFATTNPEKVLPTILSRCQRFDFRRIPIKLIISKLKKIAGSEKLKISEEAIFSIARASDGSMRDAESILDQLSSFCERRIDQDDVISLLGIIKEDMLAGIMQKLAERDTAGLLKSIDELIITGKDLSHFLIGLMGYVRNIMVLKVSPDIASLIDLPDSHIEKLKEQVNKFQIEELLYIFYALSATANAIKRSEASRFIVEASFIKLSLRSEIMSLPEIMEKITQLEAGLGKYNSFDEGSREQRPRDEGRETKEERPVVDKAVSVEEKIIPPPTESGSITELAGEKVKRAWPQILESIRAKKISVASYLLEGEIIKVENSVITLGFAGKFSLHREVLEQDANKKFIEEIISSILGQKAQLEFVSLQKPESAPGETEGEPPSGLDVTEEELEGEVARDVSEDPIIRSAVEMFGGKIVKDGKETGRSVPRNSGGGGRRFNNGGRFGK